MPGPGRSYQNTTSLLRFRRIPSKDEHQPDHIFADCRPRKLFLTTAKKMYALGLRQSHHGGNRAAYAALTGRFRKQLVRPLSL
jgi:hypothetical protein